MKKVVYSIKKVRNPNEKLSGFGFLNEEGTLLCKCVSKTGKRYTIFLRLLSCSLYRPQSNKCIFSFFRSLNLIEPAEPILFRKRKDGIEKAFEICFPLPSCGLRII